VYEALYTGYIHPDRRNWRDTRTFNWPCWWYKGGKYGYLIWLLFSQIYYHVWSQWLQ